MTDMPANSKADRRPRRIAADEAHAWARNLRLNNPHAKSVLRAVAMYSNAEGACFVSIAQLADDCEISPDTVRRRLEWLEEIGAIVKRPQWLDDRGMRNSENRGKRTTDEIVMLINADTDMIEARAAGEDVDNIADNEVPAPAPQPSVSPGCQQGLNADAAGGQDSVRTRLALAAVRGPDSLNHEPEESPESPPLPEAANAEDVAFARDFAEVYPDPITDMPRFMAVVSTFSASERRDALIGGRGYRAFVDRERQAGRTRAVKAAHLWLRDRMFTGYLNAGREAEARRELFDAVEGSEQWNAWTVFYALCGKTVPDFLISGVDGRRVMRCLCEWPAVGRGLPTNVGSWKFFAPERTPEYAAWLRRLREQKPTPLIGVKTRFIDGKSVLGLPTPCRWPPRRDGTIGDEPPTQPAMSAEDDSVLANERRG